ncbi:hypothetical protein [Paracoccus sp. TOH]|uniref:hypothetical protein n=1 Tax=Paracoccus sp. TOH TaxID=1263728 RepID=UPI0025B07EE3|nr:hypothetical protein [Paracoccus sp. TOH]WJS87269.1 hypothetical protein NBE95_20535 [Paracoccus sp. TOH]
MAKSERFVWIIKTGAVDLTAPARFCPSVIPSPAPALFLVSPALLFHPPFILAPTLFLITSALLILAPAPVFFIAPALFFLPSIIHDLRPSPSGSKKT